MSRRRRDGAALAALLALSALAAGCGGDEGETAARSTVTVTTSVSDWSAGDCDPAGSHASATYRLCYASPTDRGLDVLRRGDVEEVRVPDPPGATVGHWRWAALSPDGDTFVATWSAECEVPVAFTFPARGGTPEPVTGEADWRQAPASEALGWTTSGEPLVRLTEGACGTRAEAPGTYVVEDGDRRRLAVELQPSLQPREVE